MLLVRAAAGALGFLLGEGWRLPAGLAGRWWMGVALLPLMVHGEGLGSDLLGEVDKRHRLVRY